MIASTPVITAATSICRPNFCFAVRPKIALVHHLRVIVDESDDAECQQRKHRDPDIEVPQIGPEQRRHHDADDDQHAAHGRRAGLLLMRFRAVFANVLADLKFAQLAESATAPAECTGTATSGWRTWSATSRNRKRGTGRRPGRVVRREASRASDLCFRFPQTPVPAPFPLARRASL